MKRIDVAIAVIVRDRKVLICQRKADDTFGGFWEFPGGKRENGETLEQCLARELLEELDLAVTPSEKLTPVVHNYPQTHLTLHPFLCHHLDGEPKLIECQRAEWMEPGRLFEYRFPPANESLLREIIERLRGNDE
jgi:8-oxo-dGTP diphosphatase